MDAILLFLLTPWIFITCVSIIVISQIVSIDFENGVAATWLSILLGFLIIIKFEIFAMIAVNPWYTVLAIFGYLAIGIIWSVFKWYLLLKNRISLINKIRNKFPNDLNTTWSQLWTADLIGYPDKAFELTVENHLDKMKVSIMEKMPTAVRNKDLIIMWLSYWPYSVVSSIFTDLIKNLLKNIYNMMSNLYNKIADDMTTEFLNDLDK
jgi:hypothetical protein